MQVKFRFKLIQLREDYDNMDFQEFEAVLSEDEFGAGEFLHLEMKKLRKLAMAFTISKISNQLRQIITEDPNCYLDVCKNICDHQTNVLTMELST